MYLNVASHGKSVLSLICTKNTKTFTYANTAIPYLINATVQTLPGVDCNKCHRAWKEITNGPK